RARNVLLPRHPTAHLAQLTLRAHNSSTIKYSCHSESAEGARGTCCLPTPPRFMWEQPPSAVRGAKRRPWFRCGVLLIQLRAPVQNHRHGCHLCLQLRVDEEFLPVIADVVGEQLGGCQHLARIGLEKHRRSA